MRKGAKRAAKVGFDFDAVQPMLAKLREEVDELEEAVAAGDQQAVHMGIWRRAVCGSQCQPRLQNQS